MTHIFLSVLKFYTCGDLKKSILNLISIFFKHTINIIITSFHISLIKMVQKTKANKRKQPEDATPWSELKDGVLAANEKKAKVVETPNKKVLDERQRNYEKFLSDDIKNNSTFDTLKDTKSKKAEKIVPKKQESSSEEDSSEEEEEQVVVKPTPVKKGKANGKAPVQAKESSSEEESDSDDEEVTPAKPNGKAAAAKAEESSDEDDSDSDDEVKPTPAKQAKVTPAKKANGKPAPAKQAKAVVKKEESSEDESDSDDDEEEEPAKTAAVKGI